MVSLVWGLNGRSEGCMGERGSRIEGGVIGLFTGMERCSVMGKVKMIGGVCARKRKRMG